MRPQKLRPGHFYAYFVLNFASKLDFNLLVLMRPQNYVQGILMHILVWILHQNTILIYCKVCWGALTAWV